MECGVGAWEGMLYDDDALCSSWVYSSSTINKDPSPDGLATD